MKAQRTGSPEERLKYKELKNKVNKALRSAEAEYWTNMLSTTSKGSRDKVHYLGLGCYRSM